VAALGRLCDPAAVAHLAVTKDQDETVADAAKAAVQRCRDMKQ
jgi:hypothetical protein